MAQRRNRKARRVARRLGLVSKPGVAALLVAAVVAGGAVGVVSSGSLSSFDIVLPSGSQAKPEGEPSSGEAEESPHDEEAQDVYIVHVDGAVAAPGLYKLTGNDLRIYDAVEAAGGLLEGADTSSVNLAAPVVDGSKVHIPTLEEATAQAQSGAASSGGAQAPASTLVNINSATVDQLCLLTGIGEATAQNIIADREQNGPFTCIEDLMRVSGIGEKKFARVKDQICV